MNIPINQLPESELPVTFEEATLFKIPTQYLPKLTAMMEAELLPYQIISQNTPKNLQQAIEKLTPNKLAVLGQLANGKGYDEIAREMNVSVNTIRFRIKQIYKSLNVNNKVDASRLYLAYKSTKI
ncbi:DNA-binding NarL/FixJ family response regulator [Runella defluvii]|uniref:DNA-binding NarL/FixJ family response regulator n=1 Tax=Runella defluvii TaxID=370973 RepID=A0A7W5ZGI7_9BACT|nr:helix-turn-helix transcriptional regulator [Runella defluvii]MBB3836454.1 DNA-binding NarL/FixJ family response regulator [Runella defluvii]